MYSSVKTYSHHPALHSIILAIVELVPDLAAKGVDQGIQETKGWTPLMLVTNIDKAKHSNIPQRLLEKLHKLHKDLNQEARNPEGFTIFHVAVCSDRVDIFHLCKTVCKFETLLIRADNHKLLVKLVFVTLYSSMKVLMHLTSKGLFKTASGRLTAFLASPERMSETLDIFLAEYLLHGVNQMHPDQITLVTAIGSKIERDNEDDLSRFIDTAKVLLVYWVKPINKIKSGRTAVYCMRA